MLRLLWGLKLCKFKLKRIVLFKKCESAAVMFLCVSDMKHLRNIFAFYIFIAEALFYVISVKAKITVRLSNELLNPFVNGQWSFSFSESSAHGLCPDWLGCKPECPASKFKWTLIRILFLKVFCWLCFLSKWGVGPFKRGSHLSVQRQLSWSGEPHSAALIKKNLRRFSS